MSSYTRAQTVTVTAVTAFVALLIGIAAGKGSLDGIKEWQTALGALIALTAAIVAVLNVKRQVRMTLISREEALMEERHPGLKQAATLMGIFKRETEDLGNDAHKKVMYLLKDYDLLGNREVITKGMEKTLPLVDATTSFLLSGLFNSLNGAVHLIDKGEGSTEESARWFAVGRNLLDEELSRLGEIESMLTRRLARWEERMPRFRAQIEAYFDR